jgi:pullulanase
MYSVDILNRRATNFVLWLPGVSPASPPQLSLGTFSKDGKFTELVHQSFTLEKTDLWIVDIKSLTTTLQDGVYHYWYRLGDTIFTDPLAFTLDYTYIGDRRGDTQPPAVTKLRDGKLWDCSADGTEPAKPTTTPIEKLSSNNHLVIYELPTSWTKASSNNRGAGADVGTFEDVRALFETSAHGRNFAHIAAVRDGAILADLGINALELLPLADAKPIGEWGYATAHYFAPDADLGTAAELVTLVDTIGKKGIRFIPDVVMAFGHDPYGVVDFDQFHIVPDKEPENPDSWQSHAEHQKREGWGGKLWRYIKDTNTYDPESGQEGVVHPSWAFHKSHLARWVRFPSVCLLWVES